MLNSDLRGDKIWFATQDMAMAVKDWSASRPFLLKSNLGLNMAAKYWYTIQIGILNNVLRFVVLC